MFDLDALDKFIYAINTYNVTKSRLNNFFEDPSKNIKYIEDNFLGICENSFYVDLDTIEPMMNRYFLLKYKKSPGPTMEPSYVTNDYEVVYNMPYETLKSFAIACGYVTKRVQELDKTRWNETYFGGVDEEWEKINSILNQLKTDESFSENWPQIRTELIEYNQLKIKERMQRREESLRKEAERESATDDNNDDSKEADGEE